MNIQIRTLTEADINAYEQYLLKNKIWLFYHSLEYCNFISKFLNSELIIFLAFDEKDQLCGSLPLIYKNGTRGIVVNSLPYFGANGGITISQDLDEYNGEKVWNALFDYMKVWEKEVGIAASVLISTPLDKRSFLYEKHSFDYVEERFAQMKELTAFHEINDRNVLSDQLLQSYHQKTRNIVRTKLRSGIAVLDATSDCSAWDFLIDVHTENMIAVGALPKKREFFEQLKNSGIVCKVYVAEQCGVRIAALLLIDYGDYVEYYTPAVLEQYRSLQPLSCIIHQAMIDAVLHKKKWWNWGGTHKTGMEGVYRFKSRWGSQDFDYNYFIQLYNKDLLNASKVELLSQYENFFVVPFSALNDI